MRFIRIITKKSSQGRTAKEVVHLIDAYDRTLSDASIEIEQVRQAYLVLKGMGMNDEDAKKVARTGIFELMGEEMMTLNI